MDKAFVLNVMKIICGEKHTNKGRPPNKETIELNEKLILFYNHHYKPYTQPEQLDYEYMNNILKMSASSKKMFRNEKERVHQRAT
jgi:hypothetical protein